MLDLNRWCWQFHHCGGKRNERSNWFITHLVHLLLVLHCFVWAVTYLRKTKYLQSICWAPFHEVFQRFSIISSILSLSPSLSLLLSFPFMLFVCSTLSPTLSPRMAAWDLSVIVEDLGNEAPPVTLSVSSDLHIGGVMLKLVEKTRRLLSVSICLSQSLSLRLHRLKMLWIGNLHWHTIT